MNQPANRLPLSSHEFCERGNLDSRYEPHVPAFREAFSGLSGLDQDQIYPSDEVAIFGINYSDDLGIFLFEHGLLTNYAFRYDFPMEDASCVGGIIKLTLELNQQAEQGGGGNSAALRASP